MLSPNFAIWKIIQPSWYSLAEWTEVWNIFSRCRLLYILYSILKLKSWLAQTYLITHSYAISTNRYSANIVYGLGVIHLVFGALSAFFSICALFAGECYEANMLGSGLWAGFIYVGAGILGLLASKRWYVRRQIFIFLLASTVSFVSSIACITITSNGIFLEENR